MTICEECEGAGRVSVHEVIEGDEHTEEEVIDYDITCTMCGGTGMIEEEEVEEIIEEEIIEEE